MVNHAIANEVARVVKRMDWEAQQRIAWLARKHGGDPNAQCSWCGDTGIFRNLGTGRIEATCHCPKGRTVTLANEWTHADGWHPTPA